MISMPWNVVQDLLAALAFAALLTSCVGAWVIERRSAADEVRKRAVMAVVCIGTLVSFGAGITQRHAWPFPNWRLMPEVVGEDVAVLRIVAVDSAGVAHFVDHRAWAPLSEEELMAWLRSDFLDLSVDGRRTALADLLDRAEVARRRVRGGEAPSPARGLLGPLNASTHILHPDRWSEPSHAPELPFVDLWVVEDRWNVLARREGALGTARVVVHRLRSAS